MPPEPNALPPERALSPMHGALLILLLSFGVSITLSSITRSAPVIMDEFCYLLQADTFCHGRLTNPGPPHDLVPYFLSQHIIFEPTYCAKYPPGHGLLLALGQCLWKPLLGSWIEAAGAALAVYYLLRARFNGNWALLGGILAIFHPLQLIWCLEFWGGSLQAAGGALLLGAAIRGYREPNWKNGVVLGIGASVLALSRPFEGAVFAALCAVALAFFLLRKGFSSAVKNAAKLSIGFVPVLAAAAIFLGAYNKACTGNAFLMPFVAYENVYGPCPHFLWRDPGPFPTYPNEAWQKESEWERATFDIQRTPSGFWRWLLGVKLLPYSYQWSWDWLLLLPVCVAAAGVRKNPELIAGFVILVCFILSECQITFWLPHYFAAMLGLLLLLAVEGLVRLRTVSAANGPRLVGIFVILMISIAMGFQLLAQFADKGGYYWNYDREALIEKLQKIPGDHLVLVSYSADTSAHSEWVYNGADIEGAKVLFAHSLEDNGPLLRHFKNRKIWELYVTPDKSTLSELN